MKKKCTIIIIILLLSVGIISFKLVESQKQRSEIQDSIDLAFKNQLNNVLSSFSVQVNDYTYRAMISSVYNVSAMSDLTSYEESNDDLDISLYNLYISLREDKSKDKVLARVDELRDIFYQMVKDPGSHEATDRLIKISNETFFSADE